MKKIIFIFVSMVISLPVYSFGSKELPIDAKSKVVVGLILDSPGIGDNSINDSSYEGLQNAVDEGVITLRTKTSKSLDDSILILNSMVDEGVDIIYMIGDSNKKLLIDGAKLYPDTKFVGIDILFSEIEIKDNLYGLTFKEQDGGYLAGLVAGSLTYQYHKKHEYLNEINRVGIILGKNRADIKRYELGFYAGVKKVNPPCEIISININDLNSQEKGENALLELKKKGVDIVFSVADESDSGVFKAAEENNILVIGANRDLGSESSNILTSVVKNLSISSYLMTKSVLSSEIESNILNYGLSEEAIFLAPYYNYDRYIPKDLSKIITLMTEKLMKGSEVIPEDISLIVFDPEKIPVIVE